MKRSRARPLADLVGPTIGPALAAQGFSGADIVDSWPEIVGDRLASVSRPIRVDWPRRNGRGDPRDNADSATLAVRVEGVFALEFQHLAPLLLERINALYGWRCIGRIVLKQGPVDHPVPSLRRTPRPLAPGEAARVAEAIVPFEDPPLRAALARLGRAMVRDGGRS